jgi:hypothetical protein
VSGLPKWFADVPGDAGRTRAETGVLVELEVDDRPTATTIFRRLFDRTD